MIPIHAVTARSYAGWLRKRPAAMRTWLTHHGFKPTAGAVSVVPGAGGKIALVVLGCGDTADMWNWAAACKKLPFGRYRIAHNDSGISGSDAALAWALATYSFDRYKKHDHKHPILCWPADADRSMVTHTIEAMHLGRDLINTPASDMGPSELADQAIALAERFGARHEITVGDALLAKNYPTIHTVGRASTRAPRLIDLHWGASNRPKLTLVGKGVCFDSGGLDLKGASGMKLMKKDMGGAAAVLALASMIMAAKLPVHLRVLIPAVENSVAGDAYRPGDIIRTRKGLTVEVGNTDAEGRLVLCDALCEADSDDPDLIIDLATLTGAARVALGTELPALFCTDKAVSEALVAAGEACGDPLWPMPLYVPYRRHLDSPIADLNNTASVSEGGAITAALFMGEFVAAKRRWIHIDTMGWNAQGRPGRPVGGEVLAVRALFHMLAQRYS